MLEHLLWAAAGIGGAAIYSSFIEWALHRYVMHRPVGKFVYPFRQHTLVHHHTFKADHTYHLQRDADKWTIPMAWWNGPVLIAISSLPWLALAWSLWIWPLYIGAVLGIGSYYGFYEYMHWCMHLPKERRLERSWIFRRLNGHHLLHHRYMHKNFNVVLPLADLCLGTFRLRARTRFAQPTGTGVPCVQPREA